jgi:hypothetical protein
MRLFGTDAALPVLGLPEALLGSAGRDFCGPSWRPGETWENSLRDASGCFGNRGDEFPHTTMELALE